MLTAASSIPTQQENRDNLITPKICLLFAPATSRERGSLERKRVILQPTAVLFVVVSRMLLLLALSSSFPRSVINVRSFVIVSSPAFKKTGSMSFCSLRPPNHSIAKLRRPLPPHASSQLQQLQQSQQSKRPCSTSPLSSTLLFHANGMNCDNEHETPTLLTSVSSTSSSSNSIFETMNVTTGGYLHFAECNEPIASTQDAARKLLDARQQREASDDDNNNSNNNNKPEKQIPQKCWAVVATEQTAGRGTQGRTWQSATGNLYLTVAIPADAIPLPTLMLLPLKMGSVVAQHVHRLLQSLSSQQQQQKQQQRSLPKVTVKWPNDVLVDDAKISGCLIENHYDTTSTSWYLVGIGVNVAQTPQFDHLPGKHARAATCIRECCETTESETAFDRSSSSSSFWNRTATQLGYDIAQSVAAWTMAQQQQQSDAEQDRHQQNNANDIIVQEWKSWAEFGKVYELRGRVVDEDQGGYQGERVVTIDIESNGQLRVRDQQGRIRLLMADYLF